MIETRESEFAVFHRVVIPKNMRTMGASSETKIKRPCERVNPTISVNTDREADFTKEMEKQASKQSKHYFRIVLICYSCAVHEESGLVTLATCTG